MKATAIWHFWLPLAVILLAVIFVAVPMWIHWIDVIVSFWFR